MNIIKRLWAKRWMLHSILSTIYFNFHYLPFRQAIFLPIGLYKCKFVKLKGKVKIETGEPLKPGMISLGRYAVSIYPNNGFIYENHGGMIVFKGSCSIGNNSAVSLGPNGTIVFGDKFTATSSLRLVCYNRITFDCKVSVGWECTFMDTDFHKMKKLSGGYTKGYGEIKIGQGCWFCNRCVILKNTETAEFSTFSSCSVLNRKYDVPYAIYSSHAVELKIQGLYRDIDDDIIDYN